MSFDYSNVMTFSLGEVEIEAFDVGLGDYTVERMEELRGFRVGTSEPLPVGVTGTFEGAILGFDKRARLAYLSLEEGDVRVTVHENSQEVFRAEVDGIVCEFDATTPPRGERMACLRHLRISGGISTPFAYLYRAGNTLISHRTEGEKIYNRYWRGGPATGIATAASGGGAGGKSSRKWRERCSRATGAAVTRAKG